LRFSAELSRRFVAASMTNAFVDLIGK